MNFVRSHVYQVEPVAHGSVAAGELASFGIDLANAIDFSVNTNPLGAAPSVLEAVHTADWSRYPGDDELRLRCAIAERAGVAPEQVVLGNGSAELIWLVALACFQRGDSVGIIGPTFGEYERGVRVVGGSPILVSEHERTPPGLRGLFVCNPNNPTGRYRPENDIRSILGEAPHRLFVLDEAYAAFVDDRWWSEALLGFDNLVILRSMTKEHALPGLRLGYLISNAELAGAVERIRPPWSVNAGALRAGLAALKPVADAHVDRARQLVGTSRLILTRGLTSLGYGVEPSSCNFVLVHVGDAAAFRHALLPRGIVVRDCTSFGLPDYVRIACRLPEECERLIETVADMLQG